MSFEPLEYLRHIFAEAQYLLRESATLGKQEFLESETLRRAFVRSLEVIGEAAKNVPESFREQCPPGRVARHVRHARPPNPWLLWSGL